MNAFSPEGLPRPTTPEHGPPPATIRLEFFRHDAKEKESTAGPRAEDNKVRLTKAGREHATEVGKTKETDPEVSIAYGSPRERSTETALRHMLANETRITPDSTLEDVTALIGQAVKVGKKNVVDERLNFNVEGSKEYNDKLFEHYLGAKDSLYFIWKESDKLVKELGDGTSTSYTRLAGNVAELVDKYVKILPRWQEIVTQDPTKYAEYNNELQRYLASHQGVLESFLVRVIEKNEGEAGVQRFIDGLPDKNGFGLSEGFTLRIQDQGGAPNLAIRWQDQEIPLTTTTISEMIQERDEFNKT